MSVSPPRPKGPPLNALRAFETAARLGSFVAAAQELSVTPGAISQHVKTLESWAGVALFRRNPQGVELTAEGRSLSGPFSDAFAALAEATHALRNLHPNPVIHIAALPSIAQLWLPKRLAQLRAAFPDLTFSVTALETPPPLTRDLFDLSLFFAMPEDSSDHIILSDDHLFPVCAPNLLKSGQAPDLASARILIDRTWKQDWATWSAATGATAPDLGTSAEYSLYSLAVAEAIAGAGVLMGHSCLIDPALGDGSLVPFGDARCRSDKPLVLTLPHRSRRHLKLDQVVAVLTG